MSIDADKYPRLSSRERDRRRALAEDFMDEHGVKALLVFGDERNTIDSWFTNDRPGMTVILPKGGELVGFAWSTQVIGAHIQSRQRNEDTWIADIRRGQAAANIVAAIEALGLASEAIGVVGVEGGGALEVEGRVPYKKWSGILAGLASATFKHVDAPFHAAVACKSDEEIALTARAAELGELAAQAMIDVTRPGVPENEIYAAMDDVILRNGGTPKRLILQSGTGNSGWGPPLWTHRSQPPYVVQAGDLVMTEVFPYVGVYETQQQVCLSMGPLGERHAQLTEIVYEAHEAGLEVLRRERATFGELVEAMEEPVKAAGAWNLTPMIHSLNPMWYRGNVAMGIENHLPGIEDYQNVTGMPMPTPHAAQELRPGMTFAFEPNAHLGNARINIGGTVVKTDGEPLVLNKLCNTVHEIDV